jgi:hypothetical protein
MGALATALPTSGTGPADAIREFLRTATVRRVADVTEFRATDLERFLTVYLASTDKSYRLDELSGAADNGTTVLRDNLARVYLIN